MRPRRLTGGDIRFYSSGHFCRLSTSYVGAGTYGTPNGFCLTLRPIQLITEICIFGHAVRHRGKAFAQCISGWHGAERSAHYHQLELPT